jgi:hypothetical protein
MSAIIEHGKKGKNNESSASSQMPATKATSAIDG